MAMPHFEALSIPRVWMVNVSAKYNMVLWFKVPHSEKIHCDILNECILKIFQSSY